jgi:hypothetical protein
MAVLSVFLAHLGWINIFKVSTGFRNVTEAGFLGNEFPDGTSETIKARSFLVRKNIFVFFETV